jgi:hypothetical protein
VGLRAYFMVTTHDDLTQEEFVKAVREVEGTPGVAYVDPVIGSRDMVVMVDAPITVEALAKKTSAKQWVKNLEILKIVSIFERHKTTKLPIIEHPDKKPVPELMGV